MSTHLNVDPEELKKFADLAANWWDPTSSLKTLHQLNPLRLNYILSKTRLGDKKIIDVGCGGGILTESMAALGGMVTGIDLNKPVLEVAKLHLLETGLKVEYLLRSAEAMAEERPNTYEVITCLEMLEHVPQPRSIVSACASLAKPGADVFFSTLNRNPKAYLMAILGAEYLLRLLPPKTHDYAKFIRPSELSAWCREVDLIPKEIIGIRYNPFTENFSLTNDISVNYLFHAKKA